MFRVVTLSLFAVALAAPLVAQDNDFFGAAVAFSGRDLLVVKRAPARGPAAVHLFRQAGGSWTKVTELRAPGAIERGFALSPSIAATGDAVYVGSGDPDNAWGAHGFRHDGDAWVRAGDAAVGEVIPAGTGPVTLGTVMRILQPQARQVAASGEMLLIGFGQEAHLFRRAGGDWNRVPVSATAAPGFGASVAIGERVGFVGTPLGGGRVTVIAPAGDGWGEVATLAPEGLASSARFGAAMAFDGTTLAVGAPGAGAVFLYTDTGDGWQQRARIEPSHRNFGAAVAIRDNELLVGAGDPTVSLFRPVGGEWRLVTTFEAPVTGANGQFGTALALGDPGVAIGAPFAVGGRGRVWIYPRQGDGFGQPTELAPDAGPQTLTGAEAKCEDGMAGGFECTDVNLASFLSIESLGGGPSERVSDIWGWTDPITKREYALVGRTGALVFVDISDPASPKVVGDLPANPSGARDIKVYSNHAYMTGDGAGDHGLVVFDLTRLRGATAGQSFTADTIYHGIASAHNLIIDTVGALAIPVAASSGGETCGGGLHMVDISTPKAPRFAGCYTDSEGLVAPGRTHDAQCVTYDGPDADYQGRGICFAANETALRIVDVTDRANPTPISRAGFPGQAYIHQGWLTEDKHYYYLNDELDELVGTANRTRTVIFDVEDLDDPVMVGEFFGDDASTDHNMYVKGNRLYQANYQSGLRIWDVSDPVNPVQVGHFDTTPYQGNAAGFYGAWTAFPFFESGTVIVSSMQEGLFMLKPKPATLVP
jgi:choice-of-anchor B domain-containing protein